MAMTTSFDTLQVYIVVATIAMNPCLGYISICPHPYPPLDEILRNQLSGPFSMQMHSLQLVQIQSMQQQMHSKHKLGARF